MEGSNRKISRVDRVALAATFAATTLILVMYGLTANAAMQSIPVAAAFPIPLAGECTLHIDHCVPPPTLAERR